MSSSPLSPFLLSMWLLFAALLSLVPSSLAWSSGSGTCDADSSAVVSRTSRHPMAPTMQFYLDLPLNYAPGAVYSVSIMNTGRLAPISYFNGFLLYAIDANGNRVGRFTNPPPGVTTNMGAAAEAEKDGQTGQWSCYNAPAATATHSNGGIKEPNFALQWTAPSSDVGVITWRGLVESSGVLFYTQVLSPQRMCPTGVDCQAFNSSTLPLGPLPPAPSSDYLPTGLFPADRTSCADFRDIPFAALPPGFCASVYAFDLSRPRGIYVTPRGDMLVAETGNPSRVSLLRDLDGNGVIDRDGRGEYLRIFEQSGLNHGLYVHGGYIYTSSPTTMWRVAFDAYNPTQSLNAADAVVVVRNMPEPRNHGTRTPLVSHDGRWLYVSYGSAGNLDDDDRRARVVRYDLNRPIPQGGWQWDDYDNSDGAVQAFARGLRNEVGLTLDLQGEVWGVMNADDNLNRPDLGGYSIHNDNVRHSTTTPAERLDHLREEDAMDGFYGYPYCWAVDVLVNHSRGEIFAWGGDGKDFYRDGTHDDQWCKQYTLPATYAMQAHTAPLGVAFYDGKGKYAFPPEFYNQIIVAQHGSWNSDRPRGYKLTRIETDDRGQPIQGSATDFFAYEGPGAISNDWPHKPVDVRIGVNGELFFSSDSSGTVLVLRYINPAHPPVLVSQDAVAGSRLDSRGGPTKAWVDFSFDRDGGRSTASNFEWRNGTAPHLGLAVFDGVSSYVNLSAYNSGAGAVMPSLSGGPSSFEMWLWPEAVQANAFTTLLELADNRTGEVDDVISIALRGRLGSSSSSLVLRLEAVTSPSIDVELRDAVPDQAWTHVVVTLGYRDTAIFINGRLVHSEFTRTPPRRMQRSSALMGRSLMEGSPNRLFRGAVDVLRVYSYPLSPAQVHLNFLTSERTLISPALYGHFAMQPMESSEATFEYRGGANRRPPPLGSAQPPPDPDDSVFPGWAHFSGPGSHVDLHNPNSGIGAVWPGDLDDSFAIEAWFRLTDPDAPTSPHVLLVVDELLSVSVESGVLHFNVSVGEREQRQWLSVALPRTFRFARWHQAVWSCSTSERGQSTHRFYVNAMEVTSATTPAVGAVHASRFAVLAPALHGDVAAFRVYRQPLPLDIVNATYLAQWWGHEQPPPPQPPTQSSSSSSATPVADSSSVTSNAYLSSALPSSAMPYSSVLAPTVSPTAPPTSTAGPTSSGLLTAATVTPTSAVAPDASSSGEGGGEAESGMSTASVIALVLIVGILIAAVIAAALYFIRRRRASSGGGDERLNRLIPEDSSDTYSRL